MVTLPLKLPDRGLTKIHVLIDIVPKSPDNIMVQWMCVMFNDVLEVGLIIIYMTGLNIFMTGQQQMGLSRSPKTDPCGTPGV